MAIILMYSFFGRDRVSGGEFIGEEGDTNM